MEKSVIAEGKTTQEAIDNGLRKLKVSKNMVDVKILENNDKRSFYSILAPRVVKVELTVKENAGEVEEKISTETRREYSKDLEEIEIAKNEIEEVLKIMLDESVERKIEIVEYEIKIDVSGEKINYLIGYRGETIKALQVLLSAIANQKSKNKIKVVIDVGGYKEKRVKTLEELADKVSKTVLRTGKSIALEPMTAYERKIIHMKLQENNKIETFSKGEEPYRKVVISLKK